MTVIEQLTEYCHCETVKESDVYELINLVSSYTGWMQNPCETFLKGERKEVIDLPSCDCGEVFEYVPFYRPFDYESFRFFLVEQAGIFEETTELKECEVQYSPVDENFKIAPPLPDCDCNPCGCGNRYKLLVTYVAGYELIPECLLPMFCDALYWIAEKNKCCSDCSDCDTVDGESGIDMTSLEGRIKNYFLEILSKQYFKALSIISINRIVETLWGIVV